MVTVSLCMIVKNEEAVLARCLDSIRDAVDEIVIVDTGSSDATKEIAAHYTDKVYDFAWIDDFAAARNFSFSKAGMDFIMWLDADDVFTEQDRAAFLRLKASAWENADVVMMRYNTAFDEQGNPVFSYYRERLVRRSVPHSWKGRVHEAIVCSGRTVYAEEVAVTHRSIKSSYSDRNLRIYERQIREGETLTPRDRFYYGRELYYHRHYTRAIRVLSDFLNDGQGWVENKIEACKILAYCMLKTDNLPVGLTDKTDNHSAELSGDTGSRSANESAERPDSNSQRNCCERRLDAFAVLTRSFFYDLPRAEICCEIGNLLMQEENYRTAAFWFELARTLPRNDKSGGFMSADSYGYLPCIQLCVCYYRLGDSKKAEEYNRLAGTYRPDSPAYLHNVNFFRLQHSSLA